MLQVVKGNDGIFAEFVDDTYRIFTEGGNHSLLNFEDHPEREFSLDFYDYNADALFVCEADRKKATCLPTSVVFNRRKLTSV